MFTYDVLASSGYGVVGAIHLIFAVHLWRAGRRLPDPTLPRAQLLGALLASAAWAGACAMALRGASVGWWTVAWLFDWCRYAMWLGLLLRLLGKAQAAGPLIRPLRWLVVGTVVLTGVLLGLHVAGIPADRQTSRWLVLLMLVLPLMGGVLLEQLFRNLREDARWNAKPFVIGLACVFAFDIYLYSTALMFGGFDAVALKARGPVHLLALPLLLVAARRRSDWMARLQFSRRIALHSATLVLAGLYLLAISSVGYYLRYFGGTWGRALELILAFAAVALLAVLLLSGALRAKLRVFLGKHFFRYRFDYREEWLRFTTKLSTQGSPGEVGLQVARGLADMVECPAAGLWQRPDANGPFVQTASWNMPPLADAEPADSAFCTFLCNKAWVINLDEFRAAPRRYEGLALPTWLLAAPNAWLVVPLLVGDHLLGFVVLARPRTSIEMDWEVLDLLKTASRQAAGYLAHMNATEALLEARKFDAFNRMSAFVVHDLKNIVTQLSLMLKNAERLHDNREFQQDMLLTVQSSLEKMRRLMLQLREGASPPGSASGVELLPIVERLRALAAGQGRTLEVASLERLATRGHDDRLERVLGHLVQNAMDATPPDGRVWIGVERFSGQVVIEVGDTGAGMSEEFMKTKLFRPFNSTKPTGMGVGTFESQQYVRELGGSIEVESEQGHGTVVTVRLPLFDRTQGSDLMPLDTVR